VAAELDRRFKLEQRLRGEAVALMGGRMDEATMDKPEVTTATAPGAEDLARAVVLAKDLAAALQRPDVERHPLAHTIADTLACVRYREGKLPAAAALWQKAMKLAGAKSPEF